MRRSGTINEESKQEARKKRSWEERCLALEDMGNYHIAFAHMSVALHNRIHRVKTGS